MSDFTLYSVNWQDGMLITQRHLRQQERYLEQLAQWHAAAAGDGYGLIKKSRSNQPAISLNLVVSGSRLQVEVSRCQALTAAGHYIEISERNREVVRCETEINETTLPVYIGVDPEAKKTVGDPDPSEDLPRLPYLINAYSVHVGAPPNMPEGNCLQVALLSINGSEATPVAEYYPPCVTIAADPNLAAKAQDFRGRLENLLSLSTRAYKAITATGSLSGESTELQVAFKDAISNFVAHLAASLDEFIVGPNAGHPLQLVVYFKRLFRVFSTLMNLHTGLKDYLNEKYFSKSVGSDITRFMSSLEGFILGEYNHKDIGGQVRIIDELLDGLRGVIAFLAQTKRDELGPQAVATETLTYAGRTYHNAVYSSSRLERVGELSYLLIELTEARPISDVVSLMSKDLFDDNEWRNMQVRLGINEARGLGETDPVEIDTVTFGNKVALHPRDMLESSSVRQVTLIFRGATDADKFAKLGKMDLIVYAM